MIRIHAADPDAAIAQTYAIEGNARHGGQRVAQIIHWPLAQFLTVNDRDAGRCVALAALSLRGGDDDRIQKERCIGLLRVSHAGHACQKRSKGQGFSNRELSSHARLPKDRAIKYVITSHNSMPKSPIQHKALRSIMRPYRPSDDCREYFSSVRLAKPLAVAAGSARFCCRRWRWAGHSRRSANGVKLHLHDDHRAGRRLGTAGRPYRGAGHAAAASPLLFSAFV
mgnify:CR=1 FL=1